MATLKTIDAHVGGQPLRLVVAGFPAPAGRTMADKRTWVSRRAEQIRRRVIQEPRGHLDMCGAVFTEPVLAGSSAGLLFMDNQGYGPMSAHGVMAAVAIALERQLLLPHADGRSVTLDTTAGTVVARADVEPGSASVSFENVPSFVLRGGIVVALGSRRVRADVAFGGAFFAIVDAESVGIPLDAPHVPELRRVGMEVRRAVEAQYVIAHPADPAHAGVYGTVFTGPSQGGASDLRNVTVFANGSVDRSGCGTATSAIMAVLDAMGLLADRPFVSEGILGTTLTGRIAGRASSGDYPAIAAQIEARAWITGEHTFVADPDDPLRDGFQLS